MKTWMTGFLELLKLQAPEFDFDEGGPLLELKSTICNIVTMYAQRYEEEFAPYLGEFISVIWTLLVNTGSMSK